MSKKQDKSIIQEALDNWELANEFYTTEYRRGEDDTSFLLNVDQAQWPENIKEDRAREGRPCLTENRLLVFVNQVTNQIRQSRPAINVVPVDSGSDQTTAKIMKGLIKNIEVQSSADTVFDSAVWNAVTAGYGWVRVNTKYCDNQSFDQEIELIRIPDFQSVMLDPATKSLDGSDAEYGFVIEDMPRDRFKAKYPNATEVSFKEYKGKDGWVTENTIRIAEYFYKKYTTKTLCLVVDELGNQGIAFKEDVGDREIVQEREIEVPAVKYCKITSEDVLEETDWLGEYIPLVPCYGLEAWVDGRRCCFSLVNQAKDPQTRFNFWLTASTEIIALQPKAPFIGITGQFASYADKWSQANNKNYPFLEYDLVKDDNGITIATPPQRQPPPQGSQAMFNEMMAAADGIKSTIGLFDASIGNIGNETSGKAIQARQQEGDNSTFHFADNLQHTIRHVGRIIVDLIPKIYTGQRVLRILGDDDSRQVVSLNQAVVETRNGFEPVQQGQRPDAFFKFDSGKYDVVATVGASFATKRMETVDTLKAVIQSLPETFGIFGDILFKNMDIPDNELMVERLKKLNPAMNDEKDPMMVQLEQAQGIVKELQQQIANQQAALMDKSKKEEADTLIKMEQLKLDNKDLEIKAAKTAAEIQKITAEVQKMQGAALDPAVIQEVLQTIAGLEEGLRDTATAVEMILDNEGSKATVQPINAPQEEVDDD